MWQIANPEMQMLRTNFKIQDTKTTIFQCYALFCLWFEIWVLFVICILYLKIPNISRITIDKNLLTTLKKSSILEKVSTAHRGCFYYL